MHGAVGYDGRLHYIGRIEQGVGLYQVAGAINNGRDVVSGRTSRAFAWQEGVITFLFSGWRAVRRIREQRSWRQRRLQRERRSPARRKSRCALVAHASRIVVAREVGESGRVEDREAPL